MLDYILVGQGIAGSMLSWFLLEKGQRVMVIDHLDPSSASNIASGVINPVTGRRFVKTWMADEIIPAAAQTYHRLEQMLGENFFHEQPIIKLFDSVKSQNDWSLKCGTAEYAAYLNNPNIQYLDQEKVKNEFGGFEIGGGSRLDVKKLLSAYRAGLKKKNALLEESFSFDDLSLDEHAVSYRGLEAGKIIFCEGATAIANPYFKFLPFQFAKGECLHIEIKNFYPAQMIIGEVFIMPISGDLYYVGSTHDWNFSDSLPSETGKRELLANLASVLCSEFNIVGHYGAIRPTVMDRRPFIGFHPGHPTVGIFNGMGTKGISLAPFFAKHFAAHLLRDEPLMSEVNIARFFNSDN